MILTHRHPLLLDRKARLALLFALLTSVFVAFPVPGQAYYVAPIASDAEAGTLEEPFTTLQRAQAALRQKRGAVLLRGGTYYLSETLIFTAQDSGTKDAPVTFQAYENEQPVVSGGVKLEHLDWQLWTNGIFSRKCRKICSWTPPQETIG